MSGPLHPRLAELCAELERTRDGLLAAVAAVPAAAAEIRPAAAGWSVAETVEHLRIVEDGIGRLLGRLSKQASELGPESSTATVLGSLNRYRMLDRSWRMEAPPAIAPSQPVTLAPALAALTLSRTRLLDLLPRVSGRALGELCAPHPLLGSLTFYQWLLFLAQHEERHTLQIRETARRLLGQPTA